MKLKRALKFYFCAEEAFARLERLICARAYSPDCTRSARDCAEEVARLIQKKAEMCAFYNFLDGAVSALAGEDRELMKRYALARSKSADGGEDKRVHRVAVWLVRRLKGRAERYGEGMRAAAEFCFFEEI